jgi:hypothetical protein
MSSFNCIGQKCSAQNYALLTEILRDEWGFQGLVVTDYYSGSVTKAYQNLLEEILCGNDIPLGNQTTNLSKNSGSWDETLATVVYYPADDPLTEGVDESLTPIEIPSFWYGVRTAAKNVLFVSANSSSMKNNVSFAGLGGALSTSLTQYVNGSIELIPEENELNTDNYVVELQDETLPEGLQLSSSGLLSGTARVPGEFTINVRVKAYDWIQSNNISYSITVNPAFTFTGDNFNELAVGEEFSTTIGSDVFVVNPNFNDGTHQGYGSITYSARSVPEGVTVSNEGVISGSTLVSGEITATLRVSYTYWQYSSWSGWRSRTGSQDFNVVMNIAGIPETINTDLVTIAYATGNSAELVNRSVSLPNRVNDIHITWVSSNPNVMTNAGVLIDLPEEATNITLTATMVEGDLTETKDFLLAVAAAPVVVPPLTEADVQAMIDAIDLLTVAEVQAMLDDLDVLTAEEIETLLADDILSETEIQTLIDASILTQAEIQALIDAGVMSEADVQEMIDESLVDLPTGCGSVVLPNIGFIASFSLLGLCFLAFRKKAK